MEGRGRLKRRVRDWDWDWGREREKRKGKEGEERVWGEQREAWRKVEEVDAMGLRASDEEEDEEGEGEGKGERCLKNEGYRIRERAREQAYGTAKNTLHFSSRHTLSPTTYASVCPAHSCYNLQLKNRYVCEKSAGLVGEERREGICEAQILSTGFIIWSPTTQPNLFTSILGNLRNGGPVLPLRVNETFLFFFLRVKGMGKKIFRSGKI